MLLSSEQQLLGRKAIGNADTSAPAAFIIMALIISCRGKCFSFFFFHVEWVVDVLFFWPIGALAAPRKEGH